MWLPKIKIRKPNKGEIADVVDAKGNEFLGEFFQTFKGEFFSGDKPTSNSQPLQAKDTFESNSPYNNPNNFKPEFTPPTGKELANGSFKRYFLRDKANKNIVEITKQRFQNFRPTLYSEVVAIDWVLTPPAKDVFFNGVKFEGAETKNKRTIEEVSKTFEGLDQYIENYSQFVPESNISGDKTTPPTESNTTFDLPSPS